MITSVFDLKNGDKFAFSCDEKIIPKWSKETRHLFSKHFKRKCLILLCIQKYRVKNIDKNIFLLMMEKMVKGQGNYDLLPNEKFHEFLYYLKEMEIEKVYKQIKLNTIIYGKGYSKTDMKERFPVLYSYYKNYPVEVLQREKVVGIVEIGKREMRYYVLRNGKINELILNIDFDFFKNKKRQRQLYNLLKYNFSNIVQNRKYEFNKIFSILSILLCFLISYIFMRNEK